MCVCIYLCMFVFLILIISILLNFVSATLFIVVIGVGFLLLYYVDCSLLSLLWRSFGRRGYLL